MYADIESVTRTVKVVRNYTGEIENMSPAYLVVETDLFPRGALEFYTRFNLNQTNEADKVAHAQWYNAARGGAQGDYRENIENKVGNVVDCLQKFPQSKRAVLTIAPASTDHTSEKDAKCLRELHFYVEGDGRLHCTGFMRAQAAAIFPKNIHFIGTVMNLIAKKLNRTVGPYTHFVTTLVNDRS